MVAWDSGATPVIVLNKSDLVDDISAIVEKVRGVAGVVDVHPVSCRRPESLDVLRRYLGAGQTGALLGSSGVGKSSIVNQLIGHELLRTREVRASDSRGRHVSTARQLVMLPDQGVLIDTPGMRELQLWEAGDAVGGTFADIEERAAECRFRDCQHGTEPGCAVRAAVHAGELPAFRLESFHKFLGEQAYQARQLDERARLEEKRRGKIGSKALQKRLKDKGADLARRPPPRLLRSPDDSIPARGSGVTSSRSRVTPHARWSCLCSTPVLTVSNATKSFGKVKALDGASFDLGEGELLALLGPNGAGKTTLIRAITGRVRLDGGEVRLFDRLVAGGHTPADLGIVPQEVALYPLLTARENLHAFGRLQGLSGRVLTDQVNWVLERTGLADRAAEPIKQFSGGMRRRLNIACGIVHRPRIVLLDEPTVGVDPQSRDRIYDVLADLRSAGVSLLLTTHHLEEAEARCSRTVIIDHGKVIASGTLPELVDRTVGRHRLVTLRVDAPLADGTRRQRSRSTPPIRDSGASG